MNTTENLQLDLMPAGLLTASLSHTYAKQLNDISSIANRSGITANQLGTNLTGAWGVMTYAASMTYDLLSYLWMLPDTDPGTGIRLSIPLRA